MGVFGKRIYELIFGWWAGGRPTKVSGWLVSGAGYILSAKVWLLPKIIDIEVTMFFVHIHSRPFTHSCSCHPLSFFYFVVRNEYDLFSSWTSMSFESATRRKYEYLDIWKRRVLRLIVSTVSLERTLFYCFEFDEPSRE